jgi:hypothetical protein
MATMRPTSGSGLVVRTAIVGLAVATGWIHLTLGGLLFTLNGFGYFAGAMAMIAPLALAIRLRWLIRLGLVGYAVAAIVGWYLTGPRYEIAYVAKGIEVGLIALLFLEIRTYDGNPLRQIRRLRHHATPMVGA